MDGHIDLSSLQINDAVELLCVATKYLVEDLKTKLGKQIASSLKVRNVFIPMSTPECFEEPTLKAAIEKVMSKHYFKFLSRS